MHNDDQEINFDKHHKPINIQRYDCKIWNTFSFHKTITEQWTDTVCLSIKHEEQRGIVVGNTSGPSFGADNSIREIISFLIHKYNNRNNNEMYSTIRTRRRMGKIA